MFGKQRLPAAAIAGGLVALAALIGCGKESSVASKSAAAFREAQKKGVTFAGGGHAHGQGAEALDAHGAGEPAPPGEHGGHAAMEHGGHEEMEHAAHATMEHGGHAAMQHGGRTAMEHGTMAGMEHGGHATEQGTMGAMEHGGHTAMEHAGHGAPAAPLVPAPAAVPPGQPAATLRPDPLDSPAAASVTDAQRSSAMAREMAGGHGAHGAGNYRQVDAGRGPAAQPKKDEHEEHRHEPPGAGGNERRQG